MWLQISQGAAMRRDDICIYVGPANRARLGAIIADRNSKAKALWRARIVLAAAGHGTNAITRLTGKSKLATRSPSCGPGAPMSFSRKSDALSTCSRLPMPGTNR